MYLDKAKVSKLMNKKFNGNYNAFARELGISAAQLHRFLNIPERKAGPKMLGGFARYCKSNGIDFMDYIFLSQPLTTSNEMASGKNAC